MGGRWPLKPLLVFWAAVLSVLAAGAVTLQLLGPPHALAARAAMRAPTATAPAAGQPALPAAASAPAPPVAPAIRQAATPNPAPPLPQTAASIPDPDPTLQEPAIDYPDRVLPRISDSGRTAAVLYAAAFDPSERHPRVALVIDGAGLNRELTEQAMRVLPSAIDLAFSAYATPVAAARQAQFARRQGRECLVSVPMEPSGFPSLEEGDKSLLIGADPEQNRLDLEWALSGVQGCVGATGGSDGLTGERFAESRQAYTDMLSAIERRGLIYLDPRPGAPPPDAVVPGQTLPLVVDVIIDRPTLPEEPADAQAIDRNLARLQALAAAHGSAIGLAGPPTPVLIDRVAVWSQGLAARGIVLAPLSAIPRPHAPDANQVGATR